MFLEILDFVDNHIPFVHTPETPINYRRARTMIEANKKQKMLLRTYLEQQKDGACLVLKEQK